MLDYNFYPLSPSIRQHGWGNVHFITLCFIDEDVAGYEHVRQGLGEDSLRLQEIVKYENTAA